MNAHVLVLICGVVSAVSLFAEGGSGVMLEWMGKQKVVNHHNDVPFHVLERKYSFDAKGKHEEDTGSENMIIHGDNLVALKSLLPRYEGRVKCIYIDPPYNTGNEGWVYNDNVNDPQIKKWLGEVVGKEGEDFSRHDKWLCMMYPRLKLLQKLLAKDGCMAISIGWQEVNNLVVMCKEIFSTWQIVTVTVQTSGGKPSGGFNFTQEYVVFITPKDFKPNPSVAAQKESSPYHAMNLATFNQEQRPNQVYPIFVDDNCKVVDVGKSLQQRVKDGEYSGDLMAFEYDYETVPVGTHAVWPVTKKGVPCVWRLNPKSFKSDYASGFIKVQRQKPGKTKNLFSIQFLSDGIKKKIKNGTLETYKPKDDLPTLEVKNFKTGGVSIGTIWTDKRFYTSKGGEQITQIFGSKSAFSYPKPVDLIAEIFARVTEKDAIVLDSFAGSGTSAHAILQLNQMDGGNRKFLLVEFGEYADSVTAERVKRVITGCGSGGDAEEGIEGDFSFYELGPQLMIGGVLNEDVPTEKIREYVWYTETKQPRGEAEKGDAYKLGVAFGVAYYFCYEKNKSMTLNRALLKKIKTKAESYVVYADACTLSPEELEKMHITFKKIPRDVTRF